MNCLWILILLCCCNGSGNRQECGCNTCDRPVIMPRANTRHRHDCDYPSAPFAPERDCDYRERERERERSCECRATEMGGSEEE